MSIRIGSRTGEIAVCAALLSLAAGTGIVSAGMPMGAYNLPGPGVFPLAVSILLGSGAAIRIAWLSARRTRYRAEDRPEVRLGHRNIAIVCAALAGVALGLDTLGFTLTAAAFLLVLYRAFSDTAWWRAAVAAAGTVAGFHLFFERLIGVTLPAGTLP